MGQPLRNKVNMGDGQMVRQMDRQIVKWIDRQIDGQMDRWIDGQKVKRDRERVREILSIVQLSNYAPLPLSLKGEFTNLSSRVLEIHLDERTSNNQASSLCYRVFIKYCVFSKILIYFPDSVFSRCQCVYTREAGRTPTLQQNWYSSEKLQNLKKNTQHSMNTLQHAYLAETLLSKHISCPRKYLKNRHIISLGC